MIHILKWLGWLLIIVAIGMFIGSFWIPATAFDPLKSALPAGVLIALAGHLFTQSRSAGDYSEKSSCYHLDSCLTAFEEARILLADGNNDRVIWIAAARALVHAKQLSSRVTIDEHKRVLEVHKLKYRRFFHEALANKPASFFYGVSDPSMPIDKAAECSTTAENHGGRVCTSTVKELSESSLYAVWEAAQWPKDYEDPLETRFSEDEKSKLLVLWPGLYDFFMHKGKWISASGKLFKRDKNGNR